MPGIQTVDKVRGIVPDFVYAKYTKTLINTGIPGIFMV